jgi:hypothetical protein
VGGGMRNERISKTIAEDEGSGQKRGASFKRTRTINGEGEDEENPSEQQEDPLEDKSKKLQIFQSESKLDGAEQSMYEGGAEFASRPSKPNMALYNNDDDEDDDIRSGNFHSELREQFNNANTTKKIPGGILKNTAERPMTAGKNKEADEY